MNDQDRKFILKIANRLSEIERDLKQIKDGRKPIQFKAGALPIEKSPASKFFEPESQEKECSVNIHFFDESKTKDQGFLKEVTDSQVMFQKAIIEFCDEYDIQEFQISYRNPKKS